MGTDYYKILGVEKGATAVEIRRAYYDLSKRYHPDRNAGDSRAEAKFKEISEAYDVLSDKEKKANYDLGGVGRAFHSFAGNRFPQFDAQVFTNLMNGFENTKPGMFFDPGEMPTTRKASSHRKDATKHIDLEVSLEEVLNGAKRVERFKRRVFDGDHEREEEKEVTIHIKPGYKSGTKFTFPGDGDRLPGRPAGDVQFVLKDKTHGTFTREGIDLRCTIPVFLDAALTGTTIQIPTLEGDIVPMEIYEVLKPNSTKLLKGRGLPDSKDPSKRGDIIVHFDIIFPQIISEKLKGPMREMLYSCRS